MVISVTPTVCVTRRVGARAGEVELLRERGARREDEQQAGDEAGAESKSAHFGFSL